MDNFPPIATTWYMGSWKTSLSQLLADHLWVRKVDLDDVLLWKQSSPSGTSFLGDMSIPEYIQNLDEGTVPYSNFRARETEALEQTIGLYRNIWHILSLWWGTLEYPQLTTNNALLKKGEYITIYINTDVERILEWKHKDLQWEQNRMNLNEDEFRKRYEERDQWYRTASHIIVKNTGTPEKTVEEMVFKLKEVV